MTTPIPDELLDLMAGKFRMLADPTRLAILRCLMAGERNVAGWSRRRAGARPTSPST